MMPLKRLATIAVSAASCCLVGCAPWGRFPPLIPDVRPMRLERAQEVVNSFERNRDDAEFQAACSYWRHGQYDRCQECIESLVKRRPAHAGGQTMLMELLLDAGNLERAERVADANAGLDAAAVCHARGLVYAVAGRHDDAWTCLERAVELEPRNEDYLASLKTAEELSQGIAEAAPLTPQPPVSAAKKERPKSPRPAEFTLLTAELCLALGRPEEARRRLETLAADGERSTEWRSLLNRISGNNQDEADTAPRLIGVNDSQARPLGEAVRNEAQEPKAPASREITIVRVTSDDDGVPTAQPQNELLEQATQALAAGRCETAEILLRKARDMALHSEAVTVSTSVLPLRHDEWELALRLAEDGLQRFPRSAQLQRVIGVGQYRLGRYTAARDSLRRAIALDKDDALSYFLMGCTLNKLGQSVEAQTYYRQAQELDARYARDRILR